MELTRSRGHPAGAPKVGRSERSTRGGASRLAGADVHVRAGPRFALDALRDELSRVPVHRFVLDPSAVAIPHAGSHAEGSADETKEPVPHEEEVWRSVGVIPRLRTPEQSTLEAALSRPAVADHVAAALLNLSPHDWPVASALTTISRQWLQHRPVGTALADWP